MTTALWIVCVLAIAAAAFMLWVLVEFSREPRRVDSARLAVRFQLIPAGPKAHVISMPRRVPEQKAGSGKTAA